MINLAPVHSLSIIWSCNNVGCAHQTRTSDRQQVYLRSATKFSFTVSRAASRSMADSGSIYRILNSETPTIEPWEIW